MTAGDITGGLRGLGIVRSPWNKYLTALFVLHPDRLQPIPALT